APTTSCVLQLAAGDALAMALLHKRGWAAEHFAQVHPEGPLGRRLLLRGAGVVHGGGSRPVGPTDAPFAELVLAMGPKELGLVLQMSRKALGLALIVDAAGKLLGVFTDGDLRRIFERVEDTRSLDAAGAHAKSRRSPGAAPVPISTVTAQRPAVDCLRIMREE